MRKFLAIVVCKLGRFVGKLIGKGGKINAWMPSSAAYGAEGDKTLGVAPNATLYYEIELVDVDKYANRSRRR